MRQVKEILRQKWVLKRSHREIGRSIGRSSSTVGEVVTRAKKVGLSSFEEVNQLDEEQLEVRLFGPRLGADPKRPLPDPAWIDVELRRKGVTLQLLHLEYLEQNQDGYRYTKFCSHYRRWKKSQMLSMRQVHIAGEKCFVDYSGKKPNIVDSDTGEVREVELFVAVLGGSSLTYAEATLTQSSPDFILSHENAFRYFGGVSEIVVPDQLKSAVVDACRYEPGLQRTYEELLCHYGCVALPARQRKPKDKAKVEAAVLVAQRWILARLRNQTFFSLSELNTRISELCEQLNQRQMRQYGMSRRALFERVEQSALQPLPSRRFEYGEWKTVTLNIDYHFEYDKHYYSAPYELRGEQLEVRVSAYTVEIYLRGKRIDSHARSRQRGRHTTKPQHMPSSHRAHSEWNPTRLVRWANTIGPETATLAALILRDRPHPEQGYRSCLGLMRLGKKHGAERLEQACTRAVSVGARSYKHVAAILNNGLDRLPPTEPPQAANNNAVGHANLRGPGYYQQEEETPDNAE